MSEPPPMRRLAPSPGPSTTRGSFDHRTPTVDQPAAPPPADPRLQPAVPFLPARCQAQEQVVTTLAPRPGCPMPPTPSSTPSPGCRRARKHLPTLLFHLLGITPGTAACWTAPPSWLTTTMATHRSTPATAWALLLP